MKLRFELPEKENSLISEHLNGEEILYCTPLDLDEKGKYEQGWLVITETRILTVQKDSIIRIFNIKEGTNYRAVGMIGNGHLEGCFGGEAKIIGRFTMTHLPRYMFIARILNQLSEGKQPKVITTDDENRCPKCGRIFREGTKVCYACTNKVVILKRLWDIAKPYWPTLLLAMILFWAIAALRLVTPWIYRQLIDNFLSVQRKDLGALVFYISGIAFSSFLSTFLSIIRSRVMVKVGSNLSTDLRALVYAKIQSLSIQYLDSRKTGDLMNLVTGDTGVLQRFIQNQATMGINEIFSLIAVGIIMFSMNWKLAVLVILPAPFVMIFCTLFWKRIRMLYRRQWKIMVKANSILQDILNGIRVVKAFGQEEKEINRFKGISRLLADITIRNEKKWNTLFPSLGFIMGVGNFIVLYYGGKLILGNQMDIGELVQYSQYASIIYGPLNWLSFIPRWFAEAMTATERIFEIIDKEPDVKDKKNPISHKIKGHVVLENVTFGYRSHEPVLENINLEVQPGEMIGLVGHSGAGKSTLINLIMRFYDVDDGRILIDGIDIRDIRQQDLRSQIGVVLQETFLFYGSILENIRYSKPDASLDEVIRAAKIANAHDFIMRFPDGYDTKVGEKGHRLSGGERQRIAIARAILHNPRILILDEATSAVDTETEQEIQEALGRLVKNRTTFAIAHRLSTLKNATRLVVIDKGRIAEIGTHDELIRKKGIYYNLVMAQRQMSRMKGVEG